MQNIRPCFSFSKFRRNSKLSFPQCWQRTGRSSSRGQEYRSGRPGVSGKLHQNLDSLLPAFEPKPLQVLSSANTTRPPNRSIRHHGSIHILACQEAVALSADVGGLREETGVTEFCPMPCGAVEPSTIPLNLLSAPFAAAAVGVTHCLTLTTRCLFMPRCMTRKLASHSGQ